VYKCDAKFDTLLRLDVVFVGWKVIGYQPLFVSYLFLAFIYGHSLLCDLVQSVEVTRYTFARLTMYSVDLQLVYNWNKLVLNTV